MNFNASSEIALTGLIAQAVQKHVHGHKERVKGPVMSVYATLSPSLGDGDAMAVSQIYTCDVDMSTQRTVGIIMTKSTWVNDVARVAYMLQYAEEPLTAEGEYQWTRGVVVPMDLPTQQAVHHYADFLARLVMDYLLTGRQATTDMLH